MRNAVKSLYCLFFAAALLIIAAQDIYSQSGRSDRGASTVKISEGAAGTAAGGSGDYGDAEPADEDEVIGNDEFEEEAEEVTTPASIKKSSVKKEKTGKEALSKKTLLDRETKRHHNQMIQVNAIRKKAREMLRKADDMEAKELKRHDESVQKIKND